MNNVIYWTLFIYKEWQFYISATEKGLCYVGSPGKPFKDTEGWLAKRFPTYELVEKEEALSVYKNEIEEYLKGTRHTFTMPLDLKGTSFQLAIWDVLMKISYGEKKSYSEIANMIQNPAAVRAVGAAIGANPVLITVPCHRVVAKNGALTGYRGGLEMKEKLLTLEKRELKEYTQ